MQFTVLTASLALASTALGVTIPKAPRSIEDYNQGIMALNGTIHGIPWVGTGTIEQIYAEFTKAYPDAAAKDKRDPKPKTITDLFCIPIAGQDWTKARTQYINDGIDYLNTVDAFCNCGGQSCVRISCSWNSAIYLCNDNDDEIWNACDYMATFAQDIVDQCTTTYPPPVWTTRSGGQEFDSNNFNIIVRDDSC
ncbi:hypothetical protein G7Y89_g15311 [Cudoniella acicularis]|uniref:Uncharacterized protein n=1 Tax=Cudoniella acicularis TaxID=354080 RepID=A0A8H4QRB9_9HELO|nr:hypothetical protein G7Y89_g15311 [Cudoniella acicularis]